MARRIATLLVLGGSLCLKPYGVWAVEAQERDEGSARAPLILGESADQVTDSSSTVVLSSAPAEDFVPLLEPISAPKKIESQSRNLSHGSLRLGNLYQTTSAGTNYWISRLDSNGSIERLNASLWSVVWSGNVSYRDSNSFSHTTDFHRARLHLYQTMLSRPFSDGFVRLGRILPIELPGVGFFDGTQMETRVAGPFCVGGALGLRPDRRDLNFSGREPVAAGYSTLESGKRGNLYYSGTLGILQSLFDGHADESAVLYDQRADLGPMLSVYGTSQVNFDVGGSTGTQGTRLSRLNAYVISPVLPFFTLRVGVDKFERPDTRAERDLYGGNGQVPVNIGYRRYWVGGDHKLPQNFNVSEELGFVHTTDGYDQSLWRVTFGRMGLPNFDQALINLTVYNISQSIANGYGSTLTGALPFLSGRLMTNASIGTRFSGREYEKKSFSVSDLSGQVYWRITSHWEAQLGVTEALEIGFHSTLINSSLGYRW